VIRYLADEAGIPAPGRRCGLPAADNTHQVAQAVAPHSRVVYVDNDPLLLTHARALLTSSVLRYHSWGPSDARGDAGPVRGRKPSALGG
jgi:S-adenosyl methyltransferase